MPPIDPTPEQILRARVALLESSAAVQAMRAGAAAWEAGQLRLQIQIMRRSLFWRITLPLRVLLDLARGAPDGGTEGAVAIRSFITGLRKSGFSHAARQGQRWWRQRKRAQPAAAAPSAPPEAPAAAGTIFAPNILIVAELSVPQCTKYRVWQKQELFARLGIPCEVVTWRDFHGACSAAALATRAILYRVPATPDMLQLIARLEALGVPAAWEVDDLIFDEPLYRQNSNLAGLDPELQDDLLKGVRLYRAALLRAGRGIASTPGLAEAMREVGIAEVAVVRNALDTETLCLAEDIRAARAAGARGPGVLIVYGSGTKTHDADFREAAPALQRLMRERTDVRLRIIGELNLPPEIEAFGARVEKIAAVPYAVYLQLLGEADIAIAPLEPTRFNDAKSSIKFLEAAILGIPSVCSGRAAFADVISQGENGFLADNEAGWFHALALLAGDSQQRERTGAAALATALGRFAPAQIAAREVALLVPADERRKPDLRVLFANVFYAPRSFGGATVVVEEMARRLAAMPGTEVHVVTTQAPEANEPSLNRRRDGDIVVYAMPFYPGDTVGQFDNPEAGEMFGRILDAVQPHVVHLHSVQSLSASLAGACAARGIPYVITLHDAWWLCDRQFMVRADGTYCFQKRIDLHVCEACVPGAKHLTLRQTLLRGGLDGAALLLSPSEAHRALYLAQGIPPNRIETAPNGVRPPASTKTRRTTGKLRFGFVGGQERVKGYHVLKQAMESLERSDWELVLVDTTLSLGFSSVDVSAWRVRGQVSVLPPYSQDGLDDFFAGIDVLLFPSQWKESFGLTVREALLRDVWVIATEGGGAAEAVKHGVNGTLIPLDGDAATLRAAIEDVLDRPERVRGFTNPHKDQIIDYARQAESLHATLSRVAAARTAP